MAKTSIGSIRLLWIVSAAALLLSACAKSSTPNSGGSSGPTAQVGSVTIKCSMAGLIPGESLDVPLECRDDIL
jgi:ABC-type glycerol-3-phosphate transport system substrate-binding protein